MFSLGGETIWVLSHGHLPPRFGRPMATAGGSEVVLVALFALYGGQNGASVRVGGFF